MTAGGTFHVFGATRSYFTRKVAGYLDHKGIRWVLRRATSTPPDLVACGFPGGMPAVRTPEGELMWDSTSIVCHLERRFPEPAVLPADPILLFLCHLMDDFCDEWLYRPAVGTRWFVEENTRHAGHELGCEMSMELPLTADVAHAMTAEFVRSSCGPLGVSGDNIGAWIDEVLRPWTRVLGAHLESPSTPYLLGARPSLADFAVFGGCAAHFASDPACRRWMDEDAPGLVRHTHRILEPFEQTLGDWLAPNELPDTLLAVVSEAGRHYLPWVSAATVRGEADIVFEGGLRVPVRATEFLREARAVLLARYRAVRNDALDAVLEGCGILSFFADHVNEAGVVPSVEPPPRPRLNRPFPPAFEAD